MTDYKLFDQYRQEGFKAIRCKGYNTHNNSDKDYDTAKVAIDSGFTEEHFKGLTNDEIGDWLNQDGWIGWVIPKGIIALDKEDPYSCLYLELICKKHGIEPAKHITDNGYHYFFKLLFNLSANYKQLTKSGLELTYRVGSKNYLILAPINKRTWEVWKPLKDLPEIPNEFLPYDRNNLNDVLSVISWQLGSCLRNGLLHGYGDIDTAYMAYLIDRGLTIENIHKAFQLVFFKDYDESRTTYMYERTKSRMESGELVKGAGSFVQKIRELDLKSIETFTRQFNQLTTQNPLVPLSPTIYKGTEGTKEIETDFDPLKVLKRGSDLQGLNIPITWAVKGLIPRESITLISGKGGIGKTWLNIQLADAISKGNLFMDLESEKIPVVYIDFENSLPVLVERIKKIGSSEVLFWHTTNELMKPPRLDSDEWIVYKHLPQNSLLIFDTLRASQSKDENDSKHMAFIMTRLKELRDGGFTIILLHHTPKANDRQYKGSTAIFDLSDHVLSLYKVRKANLDDIADDDEDSECYYRFGTKDKTRYEPFHIFIDFTAEKGFVIAPDPDNEFFEAIHELLSEKDRLNQTEICELVKKDLDIGRKKTRSLLRKGEGKYWESYKEGVKRYYRSVPSVPHIYRGNKGTEESESIHLSPQDRTDILPEILQPHKKTTDLSVPESKEQLGTKGITGDAELIEDEIQSYS